MKWTRYPFDHDGGRMMAVGHQGYVYVVGAWHAKDHFQGSIYKDHWLKSSRVFSGPTGQADATKFCEVQNKRHAPRVKKAKP